MKPTETLAENTSELDLQQYWEKAMPYAEYRALLQEQAENGQTSGPKQTEALINYTQLNDRRSRRWEKRFKVDEGLQSQLEKLNKPQRWLVLNESWCGDAAHTVPLMQKLAELTDKIEVRVLWRDENLELMDAYLSQGTRGIPKLLVLNEEDEVAGEWGSRPEPLHQLVQEAKDENGKLPADFKEEIQKWYNQDKGLTTVQELEALLFSLE